LDKEDIRATMSKIRLGIVGAAGRGGSFKLACQAHADVSIHAVCDTNTDKLSEVCQKLGAKEQYADYADMLEKSDINAVVIGTPMHLHVPQALLAIHRGLHVLSEVPAAVSLDECRQLVAACSQGNAMYMMAENYIYRRPAVLLRELALKGLLGTPYYAEGEYLHELKGMNEVTKWRRKWQTGINGITYGTHSLGPILQCMPGDRVVSVCCAGSGHHYRDPRGDVYENEDSCVMLCKMRSGGLVKIRVDLLSDRPHATTNYQLQGTDGCYESARSKGDIDRIWLRSKNNAEERQWINPEDIADEFLPQWYQAGMATALKAGHGGGDYFEVLDFVDAITGNKPCPIGIHETMDMTLPGLISQQSIAQGGCWLDVPDSRDWVGGGSTKIG
jgi:predicted dehydrogenase